MANSRPSDPLQFHPNGSPPFSRHFRVRLTDYEFYEADNEHTHILEATFLLLNAIDLPAVSFCLDIEAHGLTRRVGWYVGAGRHAAALKKLTAVCLPLRSDHIDISDPAGLRGHDAIAELMCSPTKHSAANTPGELWFLCFLDRNFAPCVCWRRLVELGRPTGKHSIWPGELPTLRP